jgi:hypothetical protein
MMAFTPFFFAAMKKRGAPYTPFRSMSAIAGMSCIAAWAMRSSGRAALSRKEKAEAVLSSA